MGKTKEDITLAITKNIKQLNVESIEELILINDIAKSLNKKPKIGIRVNPDINALTHKKITTGRKTDKFGISKNDLFSVAEIINNLKNINFSGLSCHVGSQIFSMNVFEKTFKIINE